MCDDDNTYYETKVPLLFFHESKSQANKNLIFYISNKKIFCDFAS